MLLCKKKRKDLTAMEKLVIGIIGNGMIGCSTAVLTTMHGVRTVCYARNEAKIPATGPLSRGCTQK